MGPLHTTKMSAKKGKKKVRLGYRMIEMLGKKFDELDKDNSGSLTLDELFALSDTGAADAEKIMEHFDMNGDQEIRVVTHPVEAAALFGIHRSKCQVLVIARVKGSTER